MCRTLAFLAIVSGCIFAAGQSFGQMTLTGAGATKVGSATGCSQATSFVSRSGITGTDATHYTDLICGLETDSVGCSNTLDALYIWAAPDATTANLNLCSTSYGITPTNSPTFTANQGYTGTGVNAWLDTGFTPSTATTPFYVANSASLGGYVLTSRTTANNFSIAGTGESSGASASTFLISRYGDGNAYAGINGNSVANAASANAQGQWVGTRTSTTQTDLYKNGNTTAFATSSGSTSGTVPSCSVQFLSRPATAGSCGPQEFTTDQLSAGFIGKGLSAANMALVAGRINTFMTALGINVY